MRDGYVTFREPEDYSTIHSGNSNLIWDVLFEFPNLNKAILYKIDIRLLGIYSKKEYTGIGTNDSNVIWLESKEMTRNIYKSIQTLRDICLMYHAYCNY